MPSAAMSDAPKASVLLAAMSDAPKASVLLAAMSDAPKASVLLAATCFIDVRIGPGQARF